MPNLSQEGTYQVRMLSGQIKMTPTDDDAKAFRVSVKMETPDGYHCWYDFPFSKRKIQNGRNSGLTFSELSARQLSELGVKDGFVGNLQTAIDKGIECEAVLKWDEFTAKDGKMQRVLRVKYLNPPKKMIDIKDADWSALLGVQDTKSQSVSETSTVDADAEVPF